jgi:DNA-binding GntR family transcriptional regulator
LRLGRACSRDLIITNAFEMGEQLSENTLSARLGVSRTPVREACLTLQTERLLEIRPQRGIFVFTCTNDQIRDICGLREILEVASMRLAIRRDPARLIADFKTALDACRDAIAAEGVFQSADHNLHAVIIDASENPEVIEAYQMVSGRARALRYRYARTRQEFLNSQADHERIYDLMVAGEFEGAITVLSHHVYASLKQVERIMTTEGRHDA